jgi:hypothetical protein
MGADRKSRPNLLLALCAILLLTPALLVAQITEQRNCTELVKNNMAKTKELKPDVYATIKDYTFEWSRSRQSCVMVIQYKVHETGKPSEVQVVAVNAVTMQPMEGYKNVFLILASKLSEIMDAVNFLVERYSR